MKTYFPKLLKKEMKRLCFCITSSDLVCKLELSSETRSEYKVLVSLTLSNSFNVSISDSFPD